MTLPARPVLPSAFGALGEPAVFVYVKVPFDRHAADFLDRIEHRLDDALQREGTGTVVGWGDSLGDARADGRRPTAYTRIDITAPVLDAARATLHALLPALQAPADTQLHFTQDHEHAMDVYDGTQWRLDISVPPPRPARTGPHS